MASVMVWPALRYSSTSSSLLTCRTSRTSSSSGDPLDGGGLLFHLLGVLHGQEVGADKGGAALDAEPLEGLGDAVDGVGVALGIIDGELVHVEAGHVHDELGLLAPVEDDRAVGAGLLVALDVQGVAGEVGVVVGQVEEVAVAFVVTGGLAPDDGGLVTFLGHRVVDGLPAAFVFVLREV